MDSTDDLRTVSLAGVFQAAGLVQEVARQGSVASREAREASIGSVFATAPGTVEEVFGGLSGVRLGLGLLRDQLRGLEKGAGGRDLDLARYVIGLTALERKLTGSPDAWNRLGSGIEEARRTFRTLGPGNPSVAARLADLYLEHVSPLGARIVVRGGEEALTDPERVAEIRALLLAGLRSAVLWRQQGGRRRQILVGRGRYLDAAERLLNQPAAP